MFPTVIGIVPSERDSFHVIYKVKTYQFPDSKSKIEKMTTNRVQDTKKTKIGDHHCAVIE